MDTSQPDVGVAKDFYAAVFGCDYDGPGPMPESDNGGYWVAQSNGRAVAGIAALPPAPTVEVKLYFEDRALDDLWMAVTWGSD